MNQKHNYTFFFQKSKVKRTGKKRKLSANYYKFKMAEQGQEGANCNLVNANKIATK